MTNDKLNEREQGRNNPLYDSESSQANMRNLTAKGDNFEAEILPDQPDFSETEVPEDPEHVKGLPPVGKRPVFDHIQNPVPDINIGIHRHVEKAWDIFIYKTFLDDNHKKMVKELEKLKEGSNEWMKMSDKIRKYREDMKVNKAWVEFSKTGIREAPEGYKPKDEYYSQPLPFAQPKKPVKKKPESEQEFNDRLIEEERNEDLIDHNMNKFYNYIDPYVEARRREAVKKAKEDELNGIENETESLPYHGDAAFERMQNMAREGDAAEPLGVEVLDIPGVPEEPEAVQALPPEGKKPIFRGIKTNPYNGLKVGVREGVEKAWEAFMKEDELSGEESRTAKLPYNREANAEWFNNMSRDGTKEEPLELEILNLKTPPEEVEELDKMPPRGKTPVLRNIEHMEHGTNHGVRVGVEKAWDDYNEGLTEEEEELETLPLKYGYDARSNYVKNRENTGSDMQAEIIPDRNIQTPSEDPEEVKKLPPVQAKPKLIGIKENGKSGVLAGMHKAEEHDPTKLKPFHIPDMYDNDEALQNYDNNFEEKDVLDAEMFGGLDTPPEDPEEVQKLPNDDYAYPVTRNVRNFDQVYGINGKPTGQKGNIASKELVEKSYEEYRIQRAGKQLKNIAAEIYKDINGVMDAENPADQEKLLNNVNANKKKKKEVVPGFDYKVILGKG